MAKQPPLSKAWRIPDAAREVQVTKSSLQTAIKAGHVPTYPDAAGHPHVLIADVRAWKKNPPPRGWWSQARNKK